MKAKIKSWMLAAGAEAFDAASALRRTPTARVLLRHNFVFNEPRTKSLDRLRRELHWISETYEPKSVPELVDELAGGKLGDNALIYTTDDADIDAFEVHEEFRSFNVPLTMFVPIGWVRPDRAAETATIEDAVTLLHWYEGPETPVCLTSDRPVILSEGTKAALIDWLLENEEEAGPHLERICAELAKLPGSHRQRSGTRPKCSWSELRQLASAGAHIAPHSVSHVRMSRASKLRQRYEAEASKRIIEERIGPCGSFAYPYGTADSFDAATEATLEDAGYAAAFLTHSDLVVPDTPVRRIPRISLPDVAVPLDEFRYRVRGAGILAQRWKGRLRERR